MRKYVRIASARGGERRCPRRRMTVIFEGYYVYPPDEKYFVLHTPIFSNSFHDFQAASTVRMARAANDSKQSIANRYAYNRNISGS